MIAVIRDEELRTVVKQMYENLEKLWSLRLDGEGLEQRVLGSESLYKIHIKKDDGTLKRKLEGAKESQQKLRDMVSLEERRKKAL